METLAVTNGVEGKRNSSADLIFGREGALSFLGRCLDSHDAEKSSTEKALAERTLVEQATRGDNSAFVALYDQYVTQIYKHVYYRVYSQAEAEDITQETFVKAWKAIKRFQITGAPFVAWLFTIAHNLIMDHYKSKKKAASIQEAAQEEVVTSTEQSPEELLIEDFDKNRLRQAILTLKGDKQKVILMRFIDGFSYKEIAATLHKTEGAIRVIQFRALSDLRRLLTQSSMGRLGETL